MVAESLQITELVHYLTNGGSPGFVVTVFRASQAQFPYSVSFVRTSSSISIYESMLARHSSIMQTFSH
jgi:hypothetical protein